jgi:hypothetical protein
MAVRATEAVTPGLWPGLAVRIAIPGKGRANASVTHVTATWLELRLVGVDAPRPKDLHGAHCAVEYMAAGGMHRLRGRIVDAPVEAASGVRIAFTSSPQLLGRREHLRTALEAPVVLTDERTGEKFRGRSLNVSEGGMLVGDLTPALPGTGTRLRFALAPRNARDPIFGAAVVVRCDAERGVLALDFEHLSRAAADDLARIVYENEQEARAARR